MHTYRLNEHVTVFNDHLEVPGLGFLPVNAFLLHAQEPVVVDTGLGLPDRDFVDSVSSVIDQTRVGARTRAASNSSWFWLRISGNRLGLASLTLQMMSSEV